MKSDVGGGETVGFFGVIDCVGNGGNKILAFDIIDLNSDFDNN